MKLKWNYRGKKMTAFFLVFRIMFKNTSIIKCAPIWLPQVMSHNKINFYYKINYRKKNKKNILVNLIRLP